MHGYVEAMRRANPVEPRDQKKLCNDRPKQSELVVRDAQLLSVRLATMHMM